VSAEYFTFREPREPLSPIVVSVPHAGLRVPEQRKELMQLPADVFERDVDFGIHLAWETAASEAGAPYLKSEVHRYALDLNRRADDLGPKGLLWRESTLGEKLGPGGTPLAEPTPELVAELVELVWKPYYARLEALLSAACERFGFAILIDAHSMPSKGTAFHADPGGRRADFVPGDVTGTSCDARLTALFMARAQSLGFTAKANDPYRGGNITQHFGRPEAHRHALQIETNRALYIENEELAPKRISQGIERVKDLARDFLTQARALDLRPSP